MAKTKKNYSEMTAEDLEKELNDLRKGLFNLRVRKVTDVVENPSTFRESRREIARIQTELRARALKKSKPATVPAPQPVVPESPQTKTS